MRLDTFKTNEVKDAAALAELLKSKGIENEEREPQSLVILTGNKKKDNKKEDPSLRTQMLRWYNANPDMLAVGVNNLLRITREKAVEGELINYAIEFRSQDTTLSKQAENQEVVGITLLEDFLFVNYSVFEALARISRPAEAKVRHLITEDLEKLDIYKLTNALVVESRKDKSPYKRYDYVDFLDVLTC